MPSSRRQWPPNRVTKRCCLSWYMNVMAILFFVGVENCIYSDSEKACGVSSDNPTCTSSSSRIRPPLGRPLRPTDLPQPVVFAAFESNSTVTLPGGIRQDIASGAVKQINNFDDPNRDDVLADMAVLPSAVDRPSVERLLELLRNYDDWDDDPDTVDGMATHEMFVYSPTLYGDESGIKYRDADPNFVPARKDLRRKLTEIMSPYLDRVLTPAVHKRYPKACTSKGPERTCKPCYSLIRKYKHGQRQSHATHHDGHALVTVVVSLSDYGVDYRGGLYVSSGFGQHEFLALNKGDAVMHQSSLLHGVQVYDVESDPAATERWSWILWYKDSTMCDSDYGYDWFEECASQGDALCQQLHATKVGATPGISNGEAAMRVLELNMQAADGGSGESAVKIARAYLGQLPSVLPYDVQKATEYYQKAIQSHNPDGHYGMAQVLLMGMTSDYAARDSKTQLQAWKDSRVKQAIDHLEIAAYAGHAFAKFNLGIVSTFGYYDGSIDAELAGQWFEACGLPEGYFVAANQAAAAGNAARSQAMTGKAKTMGYFTPWRVQARQTTGSGGASGVDLNLPWPPSFDGRRPPTF